MHAVADALALALVFALALALALALAEHCGGGSMNVRPTIKKPGWGESRGKKTVEYRFHR